MRNYLAYEYFMRCVIDSNYINFALLSFRVHVEVEEVISIDIPEVIAYQALPWIFHSISFTECISHLLA